MQPGIKPLLLALACLFLVQCVGGSSGEADAAVAAGQAQEPRYTASKRLGSVLILEGSRRVAICHTDGLQVQEARFINGQKQLVVKSRGRHGPAVVQLFDTRTGAEQDAVLAHEIREGQPAWAAGLEN